MRREPGGIIRLRTNEALRPYPDRFHDHLFRWAQDAPSRTFLAERRPGQDGWASITYSEAADKVTRIASALAERELGPDRPRAIDWGTHP